MLPLSPLQRSSLPSTFAPRQRHEATGSVAGPSGFGNGRGERPWRHSSLGPLTTPGDDFDVSEGEDDFGLVVRRHSPAASEPPSAPAGRRRGLRATTPGSVGQTIDPARLTSLREASPELSAQRAASERAASLVSGSDMSISDADDESEGTLQAGARTSRSPSPWYGINLRSPRALTPASANGDRPTGLRLLTPPGSSLPFTSAATSPAGEAPQSPARGHGLATAVADGPKDETPRPSRASSLPASRERTQSPRGRDGSVDSTMSGQAQRKRRRPTPPAAPMQTAELLPVGFDPDASDVAAQLLPLHRPARPARQGGKGCLLGAAVLLGLSLLTVGTHTMLYAHNDAANTFAPLQPWERGTLPFGWPPADVASLPARPRTPTAGAVALPVARDRTLRR